MGGVVIDRSYVDKKDHDLSMYVVNLRQPRYNTPLVVLLSSSRGICC